MRFFAFVTAAIASVSLLDVVSAASVYASEQARDTSLSPTSSENHFDNARFTFDDARWVGACGRAYDVSDLVVALNPEQFGSENPGRNCFRTINITFRGRTTRARIVDQCPECQYGGLSISPGLADFFGWQTPGNFYGAWGFAF